MLKILLSFVLAAGVLMSCGEETEDVLASTGLDAESALIANEEPHPRLQAFVDVLELDSQQQVQIYAALQSHFQELASSKQGRRRLHRENMEARREEMVAIVRPFLNAEQTEILEEMNAEVAAGQIPARLIEHRLARMKTELSLSDEQVVQIKSLLQERHQNRPQLASGDRPSREARKTLRQYRQETHEQLTQLLSSDQEVLLNQKGAERRQRHQQRRIDRLSKDLSLSVEQEAAVGELFAELRNKGGERQQLRELDQAERQEIFRQRREEMREKLSEILTAEQLQKWDNHRPRRHFE